MINKIKQAIRILRKEGVYIFFKTSFRYFLDKFLFFLYPYFLSKVKKFNSDNINESVNFVFGRLSLIKPAQIKEEISQLLQFLKEKKLKVILEIGTANGGTLFCFCKIAGDDAKIISIDLPGGEFGGGYPKWKIPLYKSFARENQKTYLIRADSHRQETLEKVKNILNDKKVDFLFIDGDHTYQGVKKDFEMYYSLVKKDGIIGFHDIVSGPEENVGEVPKFWKEIKQRSKYQEIIKKREQGGYGIGIIYHNL